MTLPLRCYFCCKAVMLYKIKARDVEGTEICDLDVCNACIQKSCVVCGMPAKTMYTPGASAGFTDAQEVKWLYHTKTFDRDNPRGFVTRRVHKVCGSAVSKIGDSLEHGNPDRRQAPIQCDPTYLEDMSRLNMEWPTSFSVYGSSDRWTIKRMADVLADSLIERLEAKDYFKGRS